MAKPDPDVVAHLEWLGFVQPTGLVVSAPALARAGAILDRRDIEGQRLLRECLTGPSDDVDVEPLLPDFAEFARRVLDWSFSPKGYAGTDAAPIPGELEVALPDYGETLRPDYAVREPAPAVGAPSWQLLVVVCAQGEDFDALASGRGRFEASPHGRLERLLRETGVPAGLLFNGRALRLLSAPHGESSGWLQFDVAAMVQTAGRPISTAMRLLLREPRLLTAPRKQRLAALLEDSRKFQNEVSEKLAEQVLHALYELLRGFQAAHDASRGELLREPLADDPDEVYRALLTVILRLVFLLYAEERNMLPTEDGTFGRYYSLAGLYERLRDHAAHFPDTMDQRYGAWAQLLVLFRMVHDGAAVGADRLPARRGVLFDPDRYRFLEGRSASVARQVHERIEPPLVPDGTIFRALEKLLVLDGERISYRALDVEQIGSVYETMMGFRLERASGRAVAVRAAKRMGAPIAVDLEALVAEAPDKRGRWLADRADRKLTARVGAAVRAATSVEELHDALMPVIDIAATPDLVPHGAMVLQPSEERRRSGSHYTPRTLTEPIVRTTLEPVLARLRGSDNAAPRAEQVLDLKVCDPAMGSGAFLVESCRQLGDALIEAWRVHGGRPEIPPDEDEVVFARRLVAQRCLYGVDRNPVAVDLAKMSLWLATLAREHPLTFVDHALRYGDSLVGLSRRQIEAFHWDDMKPPLAPVRISRYLERVAELRAEIRNAGEDVADWELRDMWDEAQTELARVRLLGNLVILSFFEGSKASERDAKRAEIVKAIDDDTLGRYGPLVEEGRAAQLPLAPFHWEVEFPEVFDRDMPGFDVVVGNPPFAGKNTLLNANPVGYVDWLKHIHEGTHGNADLVAHFFRRMFDKLRRGGTLGLIATNTIGQGDTRSTGLRWICTHGGEIYEARRRVKWPGMAAVVVSVVHIAKDAEVGVRTLDAREVNTITAFLFHRGGHDDPARLGANAGKSFQGSIVLGMGFTFDDTDTKGMATPLAEMRRLIAERPENAEVILPYIGGEEVNTSPTHAHHRYIINFGERSEQECRDRWPQLMEILEERVKPARLTDRRASYRRYWWRYAEKRAELQDAMVGLDRMLAVARVGQHASFAFLRTSVVYSEQLVLIPLPSYAAFCAVQSCAHEIWARFLGSSMKDDLRYTPSDCFETFPFPYGWEARPDLDDAGRTYYEFRAELMVANDEGMTKTYNRFHDPDERSPQIAELRKLHAAMDRAVLDAYGWTDIPTDCEFLLDYEEEGDEEGPRRRKKPWRFRWPDAVRDEVLARLLELNTQRAAEEQRSGAAANVALRKRTPRAAKSAPQTERLL